MPKLSRIVDRLGLPAFLIGLIALARALERWGGPYWSDLGGNLIPEFLGAAVTVYGIDFIIKAREERQRLPIRTAVYDDVRLLIARAFGFWQSAYNESVAPPTADGWESMLSPNGADKVFRYLDVRKPAPTHPARPWGQYVDECLKDSKNHAERILERHATFLAPEVHHAVYNVAYFARPMVMLVWVSDQQDGTPRPTNLGSYLPEMEEWFVAMLLLYRWSCSEYDYLTRRGVVRLFEPPRFVQNLQSKILGRSRLEDAELIAQGLAFEEWRKRNQSQS